MSATSERPRISFVGHPYAPIGKGEEMRANLRALLSLDEPIEVLDVYRAAARDDRDYLALLEPLETRHLAPGTRVFHINGDEIEPVLEHLEATGSKFDAGRNIVVPAWELPVFPAVWVEPLRRFDEVWAISRFVQDALAASGISSHYVGQAVDNPVRPFLSRRYFGVRESAFVFLAFLDFSSYAARKNPWAAIEMFRLLLLQRPFDDIQLVLKFKGDADAGVQLATRINLPPESVVLFNRHMNSYEQLSLIASCDGVVSLHRSEGFGRGPAEAMRLGRLALATGWSGNLDYMDNKNSLLVNYNLIPVKPGDYVESDGQVWAEPDIEHAAALARRAIDDPADTSERAKIGFLDIIRTMGNRAVGLRMLQRLQHNPAEQPD